MREKGQTEVAKTLETPVFSRGIEILTEKMELYDFSQILISDPISIYYLTGKMLEPDERLWALYIDCNGSHRAFVNEMFFCPRGFGNEKNFFQRLRRSR